MVAEALAIERGVLEHLALVSLLLRRLDRGQKKRRRRTSLGRPRRP